MRTNSASTATCIQDERKPHPKDRSIRILNQIRATHISLLRIGGNVKKLGQISLIIILVLLVHTQVTTAEKAAETKTNQAICIFNDDRWSISPFFSSMYPNSIRWCAFDLLALGVEASEFSRFEKIHPKCGAKIEPVIGLDFLGTIETLKKQHIKRLCVLEALTEDKFNALLTLKELTHLYIEVNNLNSETFDKITQFENLEHLFIVVDFLADIDAIAGLKKLKSISVCRTNMTPRIINSLCQSDTIESVVIFGGPALSEWTELLTRENIKELYMRYQNIDLKDISMIASAKHLRVLGINCANLKVKDLMYLRDIPLTRLDVGYMQEDLSGFCKAISEISTLEFLSIITVNKFEVSDDAFDYICKMKLKGLCCDCVNQERLVKILNIETLKTLKVECDIEGKSISDAKCVATLQNVTMLGKYDAEMLKTIIRCCKNAESVFIDGYVNSDCIGELSKCTKLTRLFVKSSEIDDNTATTLSRISSLRTLHVVGEKELTSSFIKLYKPSKELKTFVIDGIVDYKYQDVVGLLDRTTAYCIFEYMKITHEQYAELDKKYVARCFPNNYNIFYTYSMKYNYQILTRNAKRLYYDIADGVNLQRLLSYYNEIAINGRRVKYVIWEHERKIHYYIVLWTTDSPLYKQACYIDERCKLYDAEITDAQARKLYWIGESDIDKDDRNASCYIKHIKFNLVDDELSYAFLQWAR